VLCVEESAIVETSVAEVTLGSQGATVHHRTLDVTATTPAPAAVVPYDAWSLPVPRLKYFGTFAVQYLIWLALYLGVNAVTAGRSVAQPLLPGEDRLPLVTAAYPFYAVVYLEIILPLFLAGTRRAYLRTQLACSLASLIAFAVYLMAPMPYPRPMHELTGLWGQLLAFEWSFDEPRCTFPSLHVAFGWLMYLGLRDEAPRWRPALLFLAVAISISTVLVKQHFVADVAGGLALAFGSWSLAGRLSPARPQA
jgi:membrane-associated phospholipid phosphatase